VVSSVSEGVKGFLVFLTSPLVGTLADTFGRKPLLVFCVLATAAPLCLLAFVQSVWVYLVVTPISGLGAATFSVVFAYIADLMPPNARANSFGTAIGLGMGPAFIVGPVTGGLIASHFSSHLVFVLCFMLTACNTCYSAAFLHESLADNHAVKFSWAKASPVQSFGMLYQSSALARLSLITLLFYGALWGVIGNLLIYATNVFDYTPKVSGLLLSFFGVTNTLIQALGMRMLTRVMKDVDIMRVGLAGSVVMLVVLGVAWEGWMLFVAVFFGAISMLTFTAVSTLVSNQVSADRQAEAQGAINGIKALAEGVGPIVTGLALAKCDGSRLPGLPFLVSAIPCSIALALSSGLKSSPETKARVAGEKHSSDSELVSLVSSESDIQSSM